MKKKVFRERYNLVNGNGEIVKEGLTIEEIREMVKDADIKPSYGKEVTIKPIVGKIKDYRKEPEVEPKKRGRKKSVK
jgi:hypothetical protein